MGDEWSNLGKGIDNSGLLNWPLRNIVTGETRPYSLAKVAYQGLSSDVKEVEKDFASYFDSENPHFRGHAAVAFERLAETVREQIALVPGVANDVADIMETHRRELAALQADTDEALGTAKARWRAADNADADYQSAVELFGFDDDLEEARTDTIEALKTSQKQAGDIVRRESKIDATTSSSLNDLNLGDLADPGFWGKLASGLWDAVLAYPVYGEAIQLVDALLNGEWARAIWRFRDLLDDLLFLVAIAAIVAAPFTGGGSLLLAVAVIASMKFLLDTSFWMVEILSGDQPGIIDPDNPGRTSGWVSVALSAFSVVAAGRSLGRTPNIKPGKIEKADDLSTIGSGLFPIIGDVSDIGRTDIDRRAEDLDSMIEQQEKELETEEVEDVFGEGRDVILEELGVI